MLEVIYRCHDARNNPSGCPRSLLFGNIVLIHPRLTQLPLAMLDACHLTAWPIHWLFKDFHPACSFDSIVINPCVTISTLRFSELHWTTFFHFTEMTATTGTPVIHDRYAKPSAGFSTFLIHPVRRVSDFATDF